MSIDSNKQIIWNKQSLKIFEEYQENIDYFRDKINDVITHKGNIPEEQQESIRLKPVTEGEILESREIRGRTADHIIFDESINIPSSEEIDETARIFMEGTGRFPLNDYTEDNMQQENYTGLCVGGPLDGQIKDVQHIILEVYIQPEFDHKRLLNPREEKTLVIDKNGKKIWYGWTEESDTIEREIFRYHRVLVYLTPSEKIPLFISENIHLSGEIELRRVLDRIHDTKLSIGEIRTKYSNLYAENRQHTSNRTIYADGLMNYIQDNNSIELDANNENETLEEESDNRCTYERMLEIYRNLWDNR